MKLLLTVNLYNKECKNKKFDSSNHHLNMLQFALYVLCNILQILLICFCVKSIYFRIDNIYSLYSHGSVSLKLCQYFLLCVKLVQDVNVVQNIHDWPCKFTNYHKILKTVFYCMYAYHKFYALFHYIS